MALEALSPISEAEAEQILREHQVPDPCGRATPESMAKAGQAFKGEAEGGSGMFIVSKNGHQLWIEAATGRAADDLTRMGLELIEEMARQAGCTEVAFQTARPGLVLKSSEAGFEIAGWIMKKKV